MINGCFTNISGHFRPFFWQLCDYISQNWGSDGHFEVLNRSKPWLIQKLWLKMQIFPFPFFCDIVEKNAFVFFAFLGFICILCHNYCTNHDSDLFSTSKWLSEPPFCERFLHCWTQKWPEMVVKWSFIKCKFWWWISNLAKTLCSPRVHFEPISILTH